MFTIGVATIKNVEVVTVEAVTAELNVYLNVEATGTPVVPSIDVRLSAEPPGDELPLLLQTVVKVKTIRVDKTANDINDFILNLPRLKLMITGCCQIRFIWQLLF